MLVLKYKGDTSSPQYQEYLVNAWVLVRKERTIRIREADKLIETAADNGADTAELRQYRQLLRDIPQTYTNPEDVVWPQNPSLPQPAV